MYTCACIRTDLFKYQGCLSLHVDPYVLRELHTGTRDAP